jgi:hypothetical protein
MHDQLRRSPDRGFGKAADLVWTESTVMNVSAFFETALTWSTDHIVLLSLAALFESTAALLLVVAVMIAQRRTRRRHSGAIRGYQWRVNAIEAAQQSSIMRSMGSSPNAKMTPEEES